MLEAGAVLRTWRLTDRPRPGCAVAAEPTFDHRLHYLDYEGPIGGGRGTVARWDSGTFIWMVNAGGRVLVELRGARLQGPAWLEENEPGRWRLLTADGTTAPEAMA